MPFPLSWATLLPLVVSCVMLSSVTAQATSTPTRSRAAGFSTLSPTPTSPPTYVSNTFAMPAAKFPGDLTPRSAKVAGDTMYVSFSQDFADAQRMLGTAAVCCPSIELWAVGAAVKSLVIANGLSYTQCGAALAYDAAAPANTNYWGGLRAGTSMCGSIFGWTIPANTLPNTYQLKVAGKGVIPGGAPSGVFTIAAPYLRPAQPAAGGANPAIDTLASAAAAALTLAGAGRSYGLVATPKAATAFTSLSPQCVFSQEWKAKQSVTLTCPMANAVIVNFTWADYGTFSGGCPESGDPLPASSPICASPMQTLARLIGRCGGKSSCVLSGSANAIFGDPCERTKKRFVALYTCGIPAIVDLPVPPSEDSPEAYATLFGGETATLSWSSNDVSPGLYAESVTVELIAATTLSGSDVVFVSAEPLAAALTGLPAPKTGLDSTWAVNVTLPLTTNLPTAWAFAATDFCRFRVRASDPSAPASLSGTTPAFLCGPPPAVSVSLSVPAASPGKLFNFSWAYPNGTRAETMGRPTVTLYAVLSPSKTTPPSASLRIPWGIVLPVDAFGPERTDFSRAGPALTEASWAVPTRSTLNAGCPVASALDRAVWSSAGGTQSIDAELAALCALTSTSSAWSLGVALERRPAIMGFSPPFAIRGLVLAPSPARAALAGGSTLSLTWDNAGVGAMVATATLCGGAVILLPPSTALPGAAPTSLNLPLPARMPVDCPCDTFGAPAVGLVTFTSSTDASVAATVQFTVAWPASASSVATISSVSGALVAGALVDFSWTACANITGYAVTLDCGPAAETRFTILAADSAPLPPLGRVRYVVPASGVATSGVCVGAYRVCLTAGTLTACAGSFAPISASATPTASQTPSSTLSASGTNKYIAPSAAGTPLATNTPTGSGTPTTSGTSTASNTPTPTSTRSSTGSTTVSASKTPLSTLRGVSASPTPSPSRSATPTTSVSRSATPSATSTRTPSTTVTASRSPSSTNSLSKTPSPSSTETRTPSRSATATSSSTPTPITSAPPRITFLGGDDGTCPAGWLSVGPASVRCFKYMSTALTWFGAREHCEAQEGTGAGLAKITQLSEFVELRALLATSNVWLGLYDASYTANNDSASECTVLSTVASRRACPHWQWASPPGAPRTSSIFITSPEGAALWGNNEPNNKVTINNARVNPAYKGEHHVGFKNQTYLNDWNPYNYFPYVCEVLRSDRFAGDFAPWTASAMGPLIRNFSLVEDATLAAAAGRVPATIALPLPALVTASSYASQEYLPCSLPPSRFAFAATDTLGRTTVSASFGITRPPFSANPFPASARFFVNDSITITWSEGVDAVKPPVITRPEFSVLSLVLVCLASPSLFSSVDLGLFDTEARTATLEMRPITGCVGGAHAIVASFPGCHAAYAPAGSWPLTIVPRPATVTFWSPACPTTAWAPGSPFIISFSLLNGIKGETVTLRIGALTLATRVTIDAAGVGRFDLGSAYPTLGAWTAASPLLIAPIEVLSSDSKVTAISCPVAITRTNSLRVTATSLDATSTAYSDAPLNVSFAGTTGSSCGTRLILLRSGTAVASYPKSTVPGIPSSISAFAWLISATAFSLTDDPAWTIAVVRDTTSTFATPVCRREGPANATSHAFRLAPALTLKEPIGGALLWPEAGRCLNVAWTARPNIGAVATTITLTAMRDGLAPRAVITGVAVDALSLSWCPSVADVDALSLPMDPWALITLSLSTVAASDADALWIAQKLTLPLPVRGTAIIPQVALTRVAPTVSILKPTVWDMIFVGRAFPVAVRIAVPVPTVASPSPSPSRAPAPPMLSFGVVIAASTGTAVASLAAFTPTSSLGNATAPFGHSLSYEIANAPPTTWASLPEQFASLALLNVDIDFVSLSLSQSPPLRLLSNAPLYKIAGGAANVLAVVTNASLASCGGIRSTSFRLAASVRAGPLSAPLFNAATTPVALSATLTLAPGMPTDITLLSPAPPVGGPGMLFSESTYSITWTPPASACGTGVLLDVVLYRSNSGVPPRDGVQTGWGPKYTAEVLVRSLPAAAGIAAWNFTSADRTWWTACDTDRYFLALVEPGAGRRIYSSTGPFRLARSTLAVSFSAAPGSSSLPFSSLFFGAPISVTITAAGFVGRASLFSLFVQSEGTPFARPFFHESRRLLTSRPLNATLVPSFGPNTPRSPLQAYTLSFMLDNVETMTLLSLPAGRIRVADAVSGVTSSSEAIAAHACAAADMLSASDAFIASGSAGNGPPSRAAVMLPPNGALDISFKDVEMPVVKVFTTAISIAANATGFVTGDAIALSLSITHTWLYDFTTSSMVDLVRDGSKVALTLPGCAASYVNPGNARVASENVLSCSITLPSAVVLFAAFGSFGGGFRLSASERASGSAGVTLPFSLTAATLKVVPPPPTTTLEGGLKFGPLSFCLDRGTITLSAASELIFSVGLALPTGAVFVIAPTVPASKAPANLPPGCSGIAWTMPATDIPATLPTAFAAASSFSLTIFATSKTTIHTPVRTYLSDPTFTFSDGAGVELLNLDPLGTTYSVKDIVQGRRIVSASVSLPIAMRDRLAAANALMTVQVRCPGFAKAGWGFVDPWWFLWNSFADLGFGARKKAATQYQKWGRWWSPWFYRSVVSDYNCRASNYEMASCSWMSSRQQAEVQALFTDPDSIASESVVASVATVKWNGVWTNAGRGGRVVQTLVLNISGKWDSISFTDGACYLQTKTNSSEFSSMPSAASGVGFCSSPGICAQFVEGVWGKSTDLYFKPMFSMSNSVKSFPVKVTLPAKNLDGRFLVSGDVAQMHIDMSKLNTGRDAVATPKSIEIELRADGFRGNAKVGSSRSLNLCPATLNGECGVIANVDITPQITRWVDQGHHDGLTYANWGEANRENTQFSFRVRDSAWRTSWLYSDSNAFAFCEWPAIDSVRLRRLFENDGGKPTRSWLEGFTQSYDPKRPFVDWAPLVSLGDPRTVQVRAFLIGDKMRVRAFGIKCHNALKFFLASYDAVAGVTTPLAQLTCVASIFNRDATTTVPVDPYSATVNCDFKITAAACSARVGSALVIVARGEDGRGQELSQYFTYNRTGCPSGPIIEVLRSVSVTPTPSRSTPPSPAGSSTASAAGTPSATPTGTRSGSSTDTGTPTSSPTPTPSSTPSSTLTLTASPSGTPTASHSLALSDSKTPSTSGTGSATSTVSGSGTPTPTSSGTPTGSGTTTPSSSTTLTPTLTDTPSVSASPGSLASLSGSNTGSVSITATTSASKTGSDTPTSSATGTPSSTQSTSDSPSNTGTPSASATSTGTPSGTLTPTPSGSDTASVTCSATPTPSATVSPSSTSSVPPSSTDSPTPSVSLLLSPTNTPSPSSTSSPSKSLSETPSASNTVTPTATGSGSGTGTPTSTPSGTDTPSASATSSASTSAAATPTGTSSDTPSSTPSASVTPTTSPSPTGTASPSSTGTGTPDSTLVPTVSASGSASQSVSSSSSVTASASTSGSGTLSQSATQSTSDSASPSPSPSSLIPGDACLSASAPTSTTVWTAGQPISPIEWSACSLLRGSPINVALWKESVDSRGYKKYDFVIDLGVFAAEAGTVGAFSLPVRLGALVPSGGTFGGGFYVEFTPVQWPARVTRAPLGTFSILDVPAPVPSLNIEQPNLGTVWAPGDSVDVSWLVSDAPALQAATDDAAEGFIVLGTCAVSAGGGTSVFTPVAVLAAKVIFLDITSFPVTLPAVLVSRSDYCVRIGFVASSTLFVLSAPLTIVVPAAMRGSISVTSPHSGSVCTLGLGTCGLSWSAAGGVSPSVAIALVQSIGGLSTPVAKSTVSASSVGSVLGIYSFSLPTDDGAFAPADLSAPFQFLVSDAANPTVSGLSPDFFLKQNAPAVPSIAIVEPSGLDEWVIGSNATTSFFNVSWTSALFVPTSDPASQSVTLLLEYRASTSATTTTLLAPISWTTLVLAASVSLSAGTASVVIPSAVPVNVKGSVGSIEYKYRVRVVWGASSSVFAIGDNFAIFATPATNIVKRSGGNPPAAPILPSSSPSASALASPTPSSSSAAVVIIPADPSPTPGPPSLTVALALSQPRSASVFVVGSDAVDVVWVLNVSDGGSIASSLSAWKLSLYRRLPSGDAQWVYDAVPMTQGPPPAAASFVWLLDPDAMPADLLMTSGYVVRLTLETTLGSNVYADSGSFTLAPFLMLNVLSPINSMDVAEGDTIAVTWTAVGLDGDVSLTILNAQNKPLAPLLAARYPVVYDPIAITGDTTFKFTASSLWGSFEPLTVRITSLTRPDYFTQSAAFRIISTPKVIQISTFVTSAAAISYGVSHTAVVSWTSVGPIGIVGAVDLVCANGTERSEEMLIDTTPVTLALGTFVWTFGAREPTALSTLALCSLRVRSVVAPLVFASSQGFSLAPASAPSLALLLPAPDASGAALATVPGALFPLRWLARSARGGLSARLVPITGGATVILIDTSSGIDVSSTSSLATFMLPLTIPANAYVLELSALSAIDGSILTTMPFAVIVSPPSFAFRSPSPGMVVVAGMPFSVTFANEALWCDAVKVVIEVFIQGAYAAGPVSLGILTATDGISSCSGTVSLVFPAAMLSGDYYLVASSPVIPALVATSPAFRVAPALAQQYINIDCPPRSVVAGSALPIYFNASGFSTASSLDISLIQCSAGASVVSTRGFVSANSTTSTQSPSCRVVASIVSGVQALSVYTWAVPTIINEGAWDSTLSSFISIVWAADESMVVQGVSCAFSIGPAPATAITSVTTSIVDGVLDAVSTRDVYVAWTRLGPSTTYSVELWQERFFYAGGDVKIATLTPFPIAALDGAYTFVWTDVALDLPSTEPVYLRIVASAGPFAGSWGRSNEFLLRSAPLPGLSEFLAFYCNSPSVPDAAASPSTWLPLCAADCAACAAVQGTWAPGAEVRLSFTPPTASIALVNYTAGAIELGRLGNTLGAFSQSASICMPSAVIAAGSSAALTFAPLSIPLGFLSGMSSTLAAIAPRNASISAWPQLASTINIITSQLTLTCAAIQPIISISVSATVDSAALSSLITDVTATFSTITSLPASSFSITADPAAEAAAEIDAETAAAAQAAGDAAAAATASGSAGGRRRLSARLLSPEALAAHATDARMRRVAGKIPNAHASYLILAGAAAVSGGGGQVATDGRRLGSSTFVVPYSVASVTGPAAVPRGVSPLAMHFSRPSSSMISSASRALALTAGSAWRTLTGTSTSTTVHLPNSSMTVVYLRVSAVASSPAAAAALRATIELYAAEVARQNSTIGNIGVRNLAGTATTTGSVSRTTTTTIISTAIIPAAALATTNGSTTVVLPGSSIALVETRPFAGTGNTTLGTSSYDDPRANTLRLSSLRSMNSAFALLKAYFFSVASAAFRLLKSVLSDPRFYAFLAFLALVIYCVSEFIDTRARARWMKDLAVGRVVVAGGRYNAGQLEKVGIQVADIVSAIPSHIPSAGLGHTGVGDALSYVDAYAHVRIAIYHLFHRGSPPTDHLGPIAQPNGDQVGIVVSVNNPLSHVSPNIQVQVSKRWAINTVYAQSAGPSPPLSSVYTTTINEVGPQGRMNKVNADKFSLSKTFAPTF